MAQTILTDAQKESLKSYSGFQNEVKWSILNKASYWVGLNGVGMADAATAIRWRKSQDLAMSIQRNPSMANPTDDILNKFLILGKNMTLWDTDVTTTVNTMLANSQFDTLADYYFDLTISTNL